MQQENAAGYAGQANSSSPVTDTYDKAYAPSGIRSGNVSSHTKGLREQLYTRQRKLNRELQEVQEALNILDNDETVNKLLKVFDVAGK